MVLGSRYHARAFILTLLGGGFRLTDCRDEAIPSIDISPVSKQYLRCTVDDMLPGYGEDFQPRWVPLAENETRSREYDCTCPFAKASYFCPHGRVDYPSWVPKVVAEGDCMPVGRDVLADNPFPPGSTILFYGNSHLRQVVESIMCLYGDTMTTREGLVDLGHGRSTARAVPPDRQCRGLLNSFSRTLSSAGCVSAEDAGQATRCSDDRAVFHFANNATVHYWFAHIESNKSVEHAFLEFGTSVTDYDVIVANPGNPPQVNTNHVVKSAQHFHEEGVPFLWLSTYCQRGDIVGWSTVDREAFKAANGKYLAVHDVMKSMQNFTIGAVESVKNDHFCLPGPPNELAILVLELTWALSRE